MSFIQSERTREEASPRGSGSSKSDLGSQNDPSLTSRFHVTRGIFVPNKFSIYSFHMIIDIEFSYDSMKYIYTYTP